MKKLGFIGTGVMGKAIVRHLIKGGFTVNIYNRTKSKTNELVAEGAVWKSSPKEITENSDIIFSIVGYPQDVEEIYYGEQGIFQANVEQKILVDMTTSTPTLAKEIFQSALERKAAALDVPVSGGDLGAINGTLTVMVGGEESSYQKVLPIFQTFSSSVGRQGEAGAGQHTKMANQIMIARTMTGMTELLVYADKANLDLENVLATVGAGSGANWSLSNYAPRILRENYSPGFFVKHFIKDLKIALAEAEKMKIDLPATSLATELYQQLAEAGHENDGTQALIKLWWSDGKRPK